MALIDTPWGAIRVPDDIPTSIACARCGTCCRAFFLSVTDETLREWERRWRAGDADGLPPDLGAVLEYFVPLNDPPPTAEGSWFTCRAFDAATNSCTLFATAPHRRPQACFAFPYVYDWATLHEAPYPHCHIVAQAKKHIGGRAGENLVRWIQRQLKVQIDE